MQTLKIQLRDNGQYCEAFYYDDGGDLCCYSFVEGHNSSGNQYRLRCKVVNSVRGEVFRNSMQRYYDSLPTPHINLVLVNKLVRI